MKKSVEYLTALYREFGDNAQKVFDFIEKNINEGVDDGEVAHRGDNCDKMVAIPVPLMSDKERVLIFDTDKKVFVDKKDIGNHYKKNLEVVVVHQNGAFIVGKKDIVKSSVGTKEHTANYIGGECYALFDFDGKKNTELLIKAGLSFDLPEGHYIPALGEVVVLRRNIEEVNSCLKLVGGDKFDMYSSYWTSTEESPGYAWSVYFKFGCVFQSGKISQYVVRAVTAFTYDV